MVCKSCGGNLRYAGDRYVCDSCGGSFSVTEYYENTEVFLCYVESDTDGRRTRDSLLAAELYTQLESHKIHTFYRRVSASEAVGDEVERACNAALHCAKVAIVFGTNKAYFESLLARYREFFSGKVVLPVYADMDAYDIPKDISAIQALDYGRVGASADLLKAVFNALGREEELNFEELSRRSSAKTKTLLWTLIGVAAVIAAVVAVWLFGMFSSGDDPAQELSPEEIQATRYDEAMEHLQNSRRAQAITLFSDLRGYKDSDKQLMLLYEAYAGYYRDTEQKISLHIQVWDSNLGVEVGKVTDSGAQCTIVETLQMQADEMSLEFHDSENNVGELTLSLLDDGVKIAVHTTTVNSDVSFGDAETTFWLSGKSDKPFTPTLDAETLLGFVRNKTYLSELSRLGFEASYDRNLNRSNEESLYRVKNTDIYLMVYTYDVSLVDGINAPPVLSDPLIVGVSAPASVIAADKIGQSKEGYFDGDLIFMPDVFYTAPFLYETAVPSKYSEDGSSPILDPIESNTPVCVIGKSSVGEECHARYVYEVAVAKAIVHYEKNYALSDMPMAYATLVKETDEMWLILVGSQSLQTVGPQKNYILDKATHEVTEYTGALLTENACDQCGGVLPTYDADSLCNWCGTAQGTYIGSVDEGLVFACPFCGHENVTQSPIIYCNECGEEFKG